MRRTTREGAAPWRDAMGPTARTGETTRGTRRVAGARLRAALAGAVLALAVAAGAAGPADAAQRCGGLLKGVCTLTSGTTAKQACGGLLQPRCPSGTSRGGSRATCGGLLQPPCTPPPPSSPAPGGTPAPPSSGCGGLLQPKCPPGPTQCADNFDNDKDGQRDLADAGCTSTADRSEFEDLAPDPNGLPRGDDVDPRTSGRLFGFNSFLGAWNSGVSPEQEAELVRVAGGNAQRFPVSWAFVQPTSPDTYREDRLTRTDLMYEALVSRGMVPIVIVMNAPVWASDLANCGLLDFRCQDARRNPPEHLPPQDVDAFGRFAAWIAQRYPQAVIEPWNEPNIRGFWNYSRWPDTGRMAAMQCAVYDAVKAVDPSRTILSPGFSMIRYHPASGQYPYVDFVEPMHAWMGRRCWDGLSVHLYPTSKVDGDGGSLAYGMRAIHAVRARAGDTTPIWVTETGASTSGGQGGDSGHTQRTDQEQLEMVRWTVNELLTTPEVAAVIMHTLRDKAAPAYPHSSPDTVQYGFGALTAEAGPAPPPKPVWCHLVGVAQTAYPGCVAGDMTARATKLRARTLLRETATGQRSVRAKRSVR